MSQRCNPGLRRLLLWGLCALLLTAQHEARQHALSHLDLQAHEETVPHHESGAGCTLCLASAAAMHLAAPLAHAAPALQPGSALAAAPQIVATSMRASEHARNRGPPSWG